MTSTVLYQADSTCLKILILIMLPIAFQVVIVHGDQEVLKHVKAIVDITTSKFESNYKCTTMLVAPNNNNDTLSNVLLSKLFGQTMVFTGDFMSGRKEFISDFLRAEVSCLVGILVRDGGDIGDVYHAMRKNWQHVTLKVGGSKPQLAKVSKATYPIIHIEEKANQNKPFSAELLKGIEGRSKLVCSGYLEGQTIIRAGLYINAIQIVDGKQVYSDSGVEMNKYLSKIYKYNAVNIAAPTKYFAHNDSWVGNHGMIAAGKYFLTAGPQNLQFHRHFELMFATEEMSYGFVSRKPDILERVDSMFRPFSIGIWILVIVTMLHFSVAFYIVHQTYRIKLFKTSLYRNEDSPINFLLYTFCKITEPDPVPWFTERWSAGKLLSFQWSLFGLLIVSIYTCNLRAHFAAVEYEKPIDTTEDVVASGKKTWISSDMIVNSKPFLDRTGQNGTIYYKVVARATEMNSFYSQSKDSGLPLEAIEEIVYKGAIVVYHRERFNHQILFHPKYQNILKNANGLYISTGNAYSFSVSGVLKKYSPVRVEINMEYMRITERGLKYKWENYKYPFKYYLNWNAMETVNERKPLKLLQIIVPLAFWSVGCILGLMTFLWETPKPRQSNI